MDKRVNDLKNEIEERLSKVKSVNEVNDIRQEYMSKKGRISSLTSLMKDLNDEEKREFGMILNEFKTFINNKFDELVKYYENKELNEKLKEEKIDISMPSTKIKVGSPAIVERMIEEVEDFFISMGYDVIDGPEIELDEYNFELLNLPKGHPARAAQDTFYLKDEKLLLRSQTSPVQVREMLKKGGKEPIRMICPGKTYRRENVDMTHEQEFNQIEGLVIDKDISLSDLKGTFNLLMQKIFGENIETRFRPSYYPFTEPSVEMDMSCFNCHGEGCSLCKPKGWITICGGGMVHPDVLRNCGYDPEEWQGFAFGLAAERSAMLKYNIQDIRVFHENDLRELKAFDRKEDE